MTNIKDHLDIIQTIINRREAIEAESARVQTATAEDTTTRATMLADNAALASDRKVDKLARLDARINLSGQRLDRLKADRADVDVDLEFACDDAYNACADALTALEPRRQQSFFESVAPHFDGGLGHKFFAVNGNDGTGAIPARAFFQKSTAYTNLLELRRVLGHAAKSVNSDPITRARVIMGLIGRIPAS